MALGHFLGKLFDWIEKIKGKKLLSVVTPVSSIVFFQDSDPSLSTEPRGHGIYPWSHEAHRDVPKVPGAAFFLCVNCCCSPCSLQSKMASAWRLEKGYFTIIPKLHALCLVSGALPLEGLLCLLSLLCFVYWCVCVCEPECVVFHIPVH